MDVSRKRILISIIFSFPLLSSLAKRLQKFSLSHSLARSLAIFPFLSFPLSHLHTHTYTLSLFLPVKDHSIERARES